MAKAQPVTDLDDASLLENLAESRQELFNLRFKHVTGRLDDTSRLRQVKRDVARALTELRAREIAAHEAQSEEKA